MEWLSETRDSYDTVAVGYDGLPHLRAALRLFAEEVRGPVADVGCGPGTITARLHEVGWTRTGSTSSPR